VDDRARLGIEGERAAERFLKRLGYRTVTRNYACPLGEIDLVALDGPTVVFVEVKTRTSREHADPQDAVDPGKQQRLARTANFFLRRTRSVGRACRFDVMAITGSPGNLHIEHFPGAFSPKC
jgi:putative endonuclease